MHFITRKTKNNIIEEYEHKTGIILERTPRISGNNLLAFCIMNGILLFALLEGSIGTVLMSFDIPVNMVLVTICNIVISMSYAMFYYRKWIKVVGYIVVLAGFAYSIINYGIIIRSGFSAITNILMTFIQDKLDLPIEREYQEYFKDRYISVTICVIFIIIAAGLMYNMIISEVKGSLFIVLTTFPFVQLGLYFEQNINVLYFGMYLIALLVITLFRGSSHYKLESRKHKGYREKLVNRNRTFDYVNDGKTGLKITLNFALYIIVVILLLSCIIPQKSFRLNTKYDSLKDDTEEIAKRIALVGLYGMFFDGSTGGVSRGRMGESKYIQYDFQTDLVMVIPEFEKMGNVYLKGFVGSMYDDNTWKTFAQMGMENNYPDIDAADNGISEKIYYQMAKENPSILHYLYRVSNVGANSNYFYTGYYDIDPYNVYSDLKEEDNPIGKNLPGTTVTGGTLYWDNSISYSVAKKKADSFYSEYSEELSELYKSEAEYRKYVYDSYLNVPDENAAVIDRIISENNLLDSDDKVEAVKEYLENNYEYSLIPGRTPSGKDFVNYFLEENKKGYCMYFASSAVLVLREMGIPARFVGGYSIDKSDIIGGDEIKGEEYDEWTKNNNEKNLTIREVEINDSSAHAWVEVYVDKFGWIPVDVTPPAEDDDISDIHEEQKESTFSRIINTIFSPQTARNVRNTTFYAVVIILIIAVVIIILYICAGCVVRKRRKNKYEKVCRENIFSMTKYLFRIYARIGCRRHENESYMEYAKRIECKNIIENHKIVWLMQIYERVKYSAEEISDNEYDEYRKTLYIIRDNVYTSMKWYKKIMFKYVMML